MTSFSHTIQKCYPYALVVVLLYSALQLFFFAFTIAEGVAPDEAHHLSVVQLYHETVGFPENSSDTAQYGVIRGMPYLYYFCAGNLLHANIFGLPDLLFLRFVSCVLSLSALVIFLLCLRAVTPHRGVHIAGLLLITNTPMYSFMSAMVSYDVFVNVLAISAFFFFIQSIQQPTRIRVGALLCILALGCLVKTAFIPLGVLFFLAVVVGCHRNLFLIFRGGQWAWQEIVVSLLAVITIALCVHLYGGNYLRYHTIVPKMLQVYSEEEAYEYRIIAQEHTLEQYRRDVLSYEDAHARLETIAHVPDRKAALFMLKNARMMREQNLADIDRLSYAPIWAWLMAESTVSIMGHKYLIKPYGFTVLYCGIMAIFFVIWLFSLRRCEQKNAQGLMFGIIAAYCALLLLYVNYPLYQRCGFVAYGIQGRYLFPVLPIYYVLVLSAISRSRYIAAQVFMWGAVGVFLYGDFPYFLLYATSEWFR